MFEWLWGESKSATTTIILLILATILSVRGAYAEPMQLIVNGQARAFLLERPIAQGPRPTIIMLHGAGGHAEAFARNVVPLSKDFHVYAIDTVGHGFTDYHPTLSSTI